LRKENEEDLKRTTRKLIEGEKTGLVVNEGKSMYMTVTKHNRETRHLEVNNYNFERVANFIYLGLNINENDDSHEKIRLR